ncbi:PD-(D/E)XK nuclease domain-containing protein [Anaerostipes hadrus]|uniref:PD-(D/E)XK nuclease domain-containing protein n=1 Tax=Anaerostipes hadrus TaxID=649756 RepID=UPI003567B491
MERCSQIRKDQKCKEALEQIKTMQYDKHIEMQGYRQVIQYGICFYKKECKILKD